MDANTLEKLRQVELEILDYIVDICDRNEIRYFLIYGTLLGAVRHSGFIPWDDDIDICLLRKDYERLCSLLRIACRNNVVYYFQEACEDDDFRYPYAKVRKRGTVFLETQDRDSAKEQGIFVDIFPLDKAKHEIGIQKLWSYLIYRFLSLAENEKSVSFYLAKLLSVWYENRRCDYLVSYGSAYPVEKDVMKAEWFETTCRLPFEGKNYAVPVGYKSVLEKLYGSDYMVLPPVEKRVTHNPRLVLFDTSDDRKDSFHESIDT